MNAPLIVLAAWLVFGASHLILGMPPRRGRLAAQLGEQRFVAMFSAVAALGLGLLGVAVALFGGEGPSGAGFRDVPAARTSLIALSFLGLTLAVAGLLNYMRSPMALFRTTLHPPAGIERITRHAFFVGLAVFAIAHALLAETLAAAIHFGGFVCLSLLGAVLQDRKLLSRYGESYARYLAETSLLPFVAVIRGRQTLRAEDRLVARLGVSAAVALMLLALHPLWSALNGAPFAGLMAVGGVIVSARRWWHSRPKLPTPARSFEP